MPASAHSCDLRESRLRASALPQATATAEHHGNAYAFITWTSQRDQLPLKLIQAGETPGTPSETIPAGDIERTHAFPTQQAATSVTFAPFTLESTPWLDPIAVLSALVCNRGGAYKYWTYSRCKSPR